MRPRERRNPASLGASLRTTLLCLTFLTAAATGCGGGGGDDDGPVGPQPNNTVDKVVVEPTESVIATGGTASLTARTLNSAGTVVTGTAVTWATGDAAVATVAPTGQVAAVANGVVRITATAAGRAGSSVVSVLSSTTQTVPAGGGTVSTPGGEVRITLPNGSVPAGTTVNIQPVTTVVPGTTVPGTVYKIGVFGVTVAARPSITVHYSVVGLPAGFDETKLTLSRKIGVFWVPLPSVVNTTQKTITATLPAPSFGNATAGTLASAMDEESTVGSVLFQIEADVSSLQLTVGERKRITARVRAIATGAAVTPSSPSATTDAPAIVATTGAATVTGTDVSVEVTGVSAGTGAVTLSTAITVEGGTERFAVTVPVTVAAATGLTVNVTGLPGGVNADVTVTGPGSFSRKLTASQDLGAIAPGTYTITGAVVSTATQTYNPSPSTQSVTLNAGESKTAAVAYNATLGSLAITVSGLPAGVNAALTVTGPGGFTRNVTASQTITGLTAGSYTVAGANVTSGGQIYSPGPGTQTVAVVAAQTANASVAYAVGVSAINVTIAGLPNGTNARVTVTGPNGFTQSLTASQSLSALAPGTYTITVQDVDATSQVYAPDIYSRTVAVVAGETATATITYRGTLGGLSVAISGLPGGIAAAVTVNGPNGFTLPVTATSLLQRLQPGSYTVVAANVTVLGVSFVGKVEPPAVSVVAGGTPIVQVTYAANVGSLTVTITPAPCPAGDVTVAGPGGFTQTITVTTTFPTLNPGAYTITARRLTPVSPPANPLICDPVTAVQQATVAGNGSTTSTTVTYGRVFPISVSGTGNGNGSVTGTGGMNCQIVAGVASGTCNVFVASGATVNLTMNAATNNKVGAIVHSVAQVAGGPCTFAPAGWEFPATQQCSFSAGAAHALAVTMTVLPPACPGERGLHSLNSEVPAAWIFANTSGQAVTVYWIDFEGARQSYGVVANGTDFPIGTYVTHPWVFVGADGSCRGGVFQPTAAGGIYHIP